MAVCAAVADVLAGSHATLDALFKMAGVPGDPPPLAHHSKWKMWLRQGINDPNADSLAIIGQLLEEFMDLPPVDPQELADYGARRQRVVDVLEEHGLRYFRGGQVMPIGERPLVTTAVSSAQPSELETCHRPTKIEELLEIVVRGLPRAMHPLTHRRKGVQALSFQSEHDIQDLLHALMRPWIGDIRAEEFTPSYAGTSTRMDFLLPAHQLVLELKLVRDRIHGRKVGDELIVDIDHYRRHPQCKRLWCVIYDPNNFIANAPGLCSDLGGDRSAQDGTVNVHVVVVGT